MRERGKVKSLPLNKRYGFIERPAPPGQAKPQDVFFPFGAYPQGQEPAVGDELEFNTVQEPGKKGPKATDIIIVAKANPSTSVPVSMPTALQLTSPVSAPVAAVQTASAPDPLDANVEILYDTAELVSTADLFVLPIIVRVTKPDGKPFRNANLALWSNTYQILNPEGSKWYTVNQNGEVSLPLTYERTRDSVTGQPGPELSIVRLHLDVQVVFGGKQLMISETVPRSQNMKAQAVPKPPAPPSPPPAPPPKPLSVKAISAELLGLRQGAICFRVNTRCGNAPDCAGITADIRLVTAMDLDINIAPEITGPYTPAINGVGSTGTDGVSFVKIWVKPNTRNGYVQFFVKGTEIKTGETYIKTSLAESARPVTTK